MNKEEAKRAIINKCREYGCGLLSAEEVGEILDKLPDTRQEFGFISYARNSGLEIKIVPPKEGVLACLEVRDPETGYCEPCEITDAEAAACADIGAHIGRELDRMAALIGAKKAREYANRHRGNQRREVEKLFRGE